MFVFALAAAALSLCTEYRVALGPLHISLPEICALVAIGLAPTRSRIGGSLGPLMLFGAAVLACAIAVMLSSGDTATMSAARNLLIPGALLLALFYARLSSKEALFVLSAFVLGAVVMSGLGILQAFVGSPPAPSIYTLHGVLDVGLRDIMAWKLGIAQAHKLIPGQKALAFGLHLFSNNFAEFIVYAMSAALTLWAAGRYGSARTLGLILLFAVALVAALSRTAMLGAAVVVLVVALLAAGSPRIRLAALLGTAGMALLTLGPGQGLLGFDRGRTIAGRAALDRIGVTVFNQADVAHMLFGGSGQAYWGYAGAFSAPHSSAIYALLNFGVLGLCVTAVAVLGVTFALIKRLGSQDRAARALAVGGLAATAWFVLYGFTWANLAGSGSLIEWALAAGVAVAVRAPAAASATKRAAKPKLRLSGVGHHRA